MKPEQVVQAFEEADAFLTDVLSTVEEVLGEDLWNTLMEALDRRRSACTEARNAVKTAQRGIGPFQVQLRGANTWDHEKVIRLAKQREELEELIDLGVIKQTFDPKAAQQHLSDSAFGIYKDDCHAFVKGASVAVQGPKPDDSILL